VSQRYLAVVCVLTALVLVWWAVATDSPIPVAEQAPPSAPAESSASSATAPPRVAEPEASSAAAPPGGKPQPRTQTETQGEEEATVPVPERTGPVAELEQRYASEPRASGSARIESIIDAQFRRPEVRAGLLQSVLCRTSVCRIETRWSPARAEGFMSALMQLVTQPSGPQEGFDPQIAIAPDTEVSADGTRAITVYVQTAGNAR